MPGGDHTCPDCGRKFASGAALGGHRRVHTKGRLTKNKGNRRRQRPSNNNHNTNNNKYNNTNHNTEYISSNIRASPDALSTEQKFYGQYITDLSSSDGSGYSSDSDNNDKYWNSNEFTAMPPPIKKRKLNNAINGNTGPTSIGYVIKSPINLKKPTKMDAIREQIGLAMALYHFNASKLAHYCDIPKQIFIKWLQGGIDQKRDVGVNSNTNNSNNNNNNDKAQKKASKTPIFKIKFKRSQVQKVTEKGYYLTPILADQIAEKMQKWLDNFIKNGFMDKQYLQFVHHYKRYKRYNNNSNNNTDNNTSHSFDNLDMKWDKLKMENKQMAQERNDNPMFDWNDDSSFYYKANVKENDNDTDNLIPIEIDQVVKGKPFKDSFLWNPLNSDAELIQFIDVLCNDLKEANNEILKDNILQSAQKQIANIEKIRSEYNNALNVFGGKIAKRSNNYLQHLKKKSINVNDSMNLMNNITDICHGHILIKLKINHGKVRLMDEFLWNLNDFENDNNGIIEEFANTLCSDQGLPFNFATSIALEIRKQINQYKIKMTKSMNSNGNNLNTINDPLSHESLRFVGRNKEIGLRNLKMWEPNLLIHKPPNTMKTKMRDQ